MATANLYLVSSVSGGVTSPDNALGNTPSTWTADGDNNTSWTHRWRLDTVAGNNQPARTQTLTIRVRKGPNSGNPTVTALRIYQGGTLIENILGGNVTVSSTTGTDIARTFAGSVLTGMAEVDVEVVTSGAPGGGSTRNAVEISMATWAADYDEISTVTHETSGVLVSGSAVASGAASRFSVRETSGALASQPATVAGSASRTRVHATSGALVAAQASVTGAALRDVAALYYVVYPAAESAPSAAQVVSGMAWGPAVAAGSAEARATTGEQSFPEVEGLSAGTCRAAFVWHSGADYSNVAVSDPEVIGGDTHATSGALVASASVITGSASRTRVHVTSGALSAGSAQVAGTAARTRIHATSGALTGQPATVAGAAARTRIHATSGALAATAAAVAGSAARQVTHTTSGALTAGAALLNGAADRIEVGQPHDTTGALAAGAATVAGAASRTRIHATSGALSAGSAQISGTAARTRVHATSGALAAGQAQAIGAALRARIHAAEGAIAAGPAVMAGVAALQTGPVTHDTTGALVSGAAIMAGLAAREGEGLPSAPAKRVLAVAREPRVLAVAREIRTLTIRGY